MSGKVNPALSLEDLAQVPPVNPEYFNFGYDVVDQWAGRDRNKLAMVWVNQKGEERKLTFYDLSRLSNQAANLLIKHGVTRGDRVMLMMPRMVEWWIFSLALIKLGAVQCPSPTLLTPADLLYRVNYGKFKVAITDAENAEKFDAIFDGCPTLALRVLANGHRDGWVCYEEEIKSPAAPSRNAVNSAGLIRTRSDEPMLFLFTSGTSKHPKMVLHSHNYALGHIITAKVWHGLSSGDLHFTVSDTGWGKNLWGNYFGQWIIGTCVFIYDIRGKFHAEDLLPVLEKYEVTSFCAPPTVYRMLVLSDISKFDLSALKHCASAGEPLHTETVRLWKDSTGLTIREGYGQTETVCLIATPEGIEAKPGAMGKAMPGWDIELQDDDGNTVSAGGEGRIAVNLKTSSKIGLFLGYYENEEENKRAFVGDYYHTGDKARLDGDGYFWFIGRSDDVIKCSGYRIGPSEVEDVLLQHPSVKESAVIGAPDPVRGMKVKAYIVLREEYYPTESLVRELQNHVKNQTAPYKYPREIEFVEKMPKTFSGKIKRDLLRLHTETGEMNW